MGGGGEEGVATQQRISTVNAVPAPPVPVCGQQLSSTRDTDRHPTSMHAGKAWVVAVLSFWGCVLLGTAAPAVLWPELPDGRPVRHALGVHPLVQRAAAAAPRAAIAPLVLEHDH